MANHSYDLMVFSDIHAGCKLALCPETGVVLDEGGVYTPSPFQLKLLSAWKDMWQRVKAICKGSPLTCVFNGDALDGVHHNTTTQITNNLTIQKRIARELLSPVVELCEGRYHHIRGTQAHVGPSACDEEELADSLNAIPNVEGQYAKYELWHFLGGGLIHFLHHIGTTGSQAYESTAVHKELIDTYAEASRWRFRPPDLVVRSHRHRYIKTEIATDRGVGASLVTPGWQGKTPFVWRLPGGRLAPPQFGGVLIRWHPRDKVLYSIPFVYAIKPDIPETPYDLAA